MKIIYLVSVIILLISFILKRKSNQKIKLISFFCISIVLLFCYNTFICYILTFFTIQIKLWILALINLIISTILILYIKKDGTVQKYNLNKSDIIYTILILLVALIVSYFDFGFPPFNVNYETGDPSVHYLTSVRFAESESLMPGIEKWDEVYGSLDVRKPVSYVNSGLLMRCLCPNLNPMDCYNVFVCFGIFILALTGISLYGAFSNYAENRLHKFIAFVIALICMLGYPLNSLLFGFEYLSMGILILVVIIDAIYYYSNRILNFKSLILIFTLLNFGLFCSYYMFVPFVYSALWIYFCIDNYREKRKIISKKLIIFLSITLLIPFILGFIYHLEPEIYAIFINKKIEISTISEYSSYIASEGLKVDGYIYINIYSNMLLLMPLTIYLFIVDMKKNLKDVMFIYILTILTLGFIGILLIGNHIGKVSIYYLSKNYFALWIILAYTNYKALILITKKSKYLTSLFLISYVFLMILCIIVSKVRVGYVLKNVNENILSVMEIFGANKNILFDKPVEFNKDEIEILNYVRENLDYSSEIEIVTDENAYYWSYVLLRYVNKEERFKGKHGRTK